MLPVERELKQPAKSLMLASFGLALAAAAYGVFSLESDSLFGVTLPRGIVPVFVAILLGLGVMALRASVGEELCRRCKVRLTKTWLTFAASDAPAAVRCAERGDAREIPEPLSNEADGALRIEVSYCSECRQVTLLEAVNAQARTTLVSKHAIVGPNVSRWIALAEARTVAR